VAQLWSLGIKRMSSYSSKRIKIPWLKLRPVLVWLAWVALSWFVWCAGVVEVNGLYPDWDEDLGRIFGLLIHGTLIFAWSFWVLWLLIGHRRRLYSWFQIGVCIALLLTIVRDCFMADVIKILHL
jgi:hypothetical protein